MRGGIVVVREVAHAEIHLGLTSINPNLGGLNAVLLGKSKVTTAIVAEVVKFVLAAHGLGAARAVIVVVGSEAPLVVMEVRGETSREALASRCGHTALVSKNRGSKGKRN